MSADGGHSFRQKNPAFVKNRTSILFIFGDRDLSINEEKQVIKKVATPDMREEIARRYWLSSCVTHEGDAWDNDQKLVPERWNEEFWQERSSVLNVRFSVDAFLQVLEDMNMKIVSAE